MTVAFQPVVRRGDKSTWQTANPVLLAGEPGYESTRRQVRVGDGVTNWNDLPVVGREDQNLINVRDYGAKGDGVTDDSAAFLAAFTDAVAGSLTTFMQYTDRRSVHGIFIPAGTYLIKGSAKLIADVGSGKISGFLFRGAGLDTTHIVFEPTTANQYLALNNNRFYHLTFEDLSFHVSNGGGNAATATLFNSDSDGTAQNYVFWRCNFMGAFKYGFNLTGSNNNSELSFYSCGMHAVMTGGAFLYSGSSDTSDQFLNYNFFACNVEYPAGNFIDMAKGGNINVWGGSFIHNGDGSATQCFFRLRGTGHTGGVMRLYVAGIRVEHRHLLSQLIDCEWDRGNVTFVSCDTETDYFIVSNYKNLVQAKFGHGNGAYPIIVFDGCSVSGKHDYHYRNGGHNFQPEIEYRSCMFATDNVSPFNQKAHDSFTFTNDDSTTNIAARPPIRVVRSKAALQADYKEVFDCTLNYETAMNIDVPPRKVFVRTVTGGMPTSAGTINVNLPLNAQVTRVRAKKRAGGSSTATTSTYTVADGAGTTLVTVGTGGAAWNTAWQYDSGELNIAPLDDTKRKLAITSNQSEGTTLGALEIEFIA